MESKIIFCDLRLREKFEKLKVGKYEEKQIYDWILIALNELSKNTYAGIQIPKRLIPKEYLRYRVDNIKKTLLFYHTIRCGLFVGFLGCSEIENSNDWLTTT